MGDSSGAVLSAFAHHALGFGCFGYYVHQSVRSTFSSSDYGRAILKLSCRTGYSQNSSVSAKCTKRSVVKEYTNLPLTRR